MSRQRKPRAWDRYILNQRGQRDARQWESWAAANGWSYRATDPGLVDLYVSHRPEEAANAFNVLEGTVNGRPVRAFEYVSFQGARHGHGAAGATSALVVLGLPGRPPPEVVAQGIGRAITGLGGSIPHDTEVDVHGAELVLWRAGRLQPKNLIGDTELLTRQINSMPPGFWRAAP